MILQHVLDTLTATGIRVEAENGNLRYHSPTPLDGERIRLIRSHKAELVRLLEAREALPSSQGAAAAEYDARTPEAAPEPELATLRTIFRATIAEGHALHRCDSSEQSQRWAEFLNQHLPEGRECFVIRNREVNCYRY